MSEGREEALEHWSDEDDGAMERGMYIVE